jgi:uncharacterized protein with PQ loop repeat
MPAEMAYKQAVAYTWIKGVIDLSILILCVFGFLATAWKIHQILKEEETSLNITCTLMLPICITGVVYFPISVAVVFSLARILWPEQMFNYAIISKILN